MTAQTVLVFLIEIPLDGIGVFDVLLNPVLASVVQQISFHPVEEKRIAKIGKVKGPESFLFFAFPFPQQDGAVHRLGIVHIPLFIFRVFVRKKFYGSVWTNLD